METIFVAICFMIMGGIGLNALLPALRKRNQVQSWHKTEGRIIERGVFQTYNPGRLKSPKFNYAPKVKYAYTVNGKEYTGENLYHTEIDLTSVSGEPWARKRADSFPDEVTVNYNPENPADSFLFTLSKPFFILYVVFAFVCGLMFLTGIGILLSFVL